METYENIENLPVFEVRTKDGNYSIYVNGKIEGFPDGDNIIINRIPILIHLAVGQAIESHKRSTQ